MQSTSKNLLIAAIVVVIAVVAYMVLAQPDRRTTSEKIGDAVQELPNGPDRALHELGSNRTPGEKVGDAVNDVGDQIKDSSHPNE
ncbi:MAG: hypothetical protein AB7H77_11210 [Bdellovibrionales bacterium]